MVEISKAFEYEEFNAFDRKRFPKVSPCCEYPQRSIIDVDCHEIHTVQKAHTMWSGRNCVCKSGDKSG